MAEWKLALYEDSTDNQMQRQGKDTRELWLVLAMEHLILHDCEYSAGLRPR